MDLRCTQQDGSWLKVQELAAYVSPAKWHESQSNIPSNGVQSGGRNSSRSQKNHLLLCDLSAAEWKLSQLAGGSSVASHFSGR
jgi:hypothetical protein